MKKLFILILVVSTLLSSSVVAFGLTSPANSRSNGVLTAMFVTEDIGVLLGAEYGLSPKFAVTGEVSMGDRDFTKAGVKYELHPNFAIVGGVMGLEDTDPFFGINGSLTFDRDFMGIIEVDGVMADDVYIIYEAGVKYNLNKQLDIRGGVFGWSGDGSSENAFQLGAGYKF